MDDPFLERVEERERMVRDQLERRGITDPRVLAAMRRVPRHAFVPRGAAAHAYEDGPLLIGGGQTISQPYVVAAMTEALELSPEDRVLEIGAGSGYQTAVLCEIARDVVAIEVRVDHAAAAARRLAALGYRPRLLHGDGSLGAPDRAPFDAILAAAAPESIPSALIAQLALGGRMVLPVGRVEQHVERVRRTAAGLTYERLFPVRFVPMIGRGSGDPNSG